MILIADNDNNSKQVLNSKLIDNGFSVTTVSLNTNIETVIAKHKPLLVIGSVILDKEDRNFRMFQSLIKKKVFEKIKLFLLIQPCVPQNPRIKRKETVQIDCDGFCDKPVDMIDFIRKVSCLVEK